MGNIDKLYHHVIKSSKHSSQRIKQRAGCKTRKKRSKFINGIFRKGLRIKDIPNKIDLLPFIYYMKGKAAVMRKRNPYSQLYLYKDYFAIVSLTGTLITVLNVDKEYKGTYVKIYSILSGGM